MTQMAKIDTLFIPITNEKSSHKEAPSVPATTLICTYQRPSQGVDSGDIRGNSAGFADFCRQFLARDVAIGPLLHFRGKIHGERPVGFVTSPPSWKWKIRTALSAYIALIVKTGRSKCTGMFVEIVILWLKSWSSLCTENRWTSYFCLLYLLLLRYNLGVLSNDAPWGRDSGSFSWTNLQMSWCKCPGVPGGQPPGMAADECIIGHYRNVRGLGKSMVVFRLFEKLRFSNERSTIFQSLYHE